MKEANMTIQELMRERGIKVVARIDGIEFATLPEDPPAEQKFGLLELLGVRDRSEEHIAAMKHHLECDPVGFAASIMAWCEGDEKSQEAFAMVVRETGVATDTLYQGQPLWQHAVKWLRPAAIAVLTGRSVRVELGNVDVKVNAGLFRTREETVRLSYPATIECG